MKYFEILQDNRIRYEYKIESFSLEEIEEENEVKKLVGMVSFKGNLEDLPDFISYKNDFFVSSELKKVMEMYSDDLIYTLVIFNNIDVKIQKEYYKIEAPLIKGLSEKSIYYKDNSVKEKIIKYELVRDYPIFRLKEIESTKFSSKHIFAHLDIVESSLRRNLWGMLFEEVIVED